MIDKEYADLRGRLDAAETVLQLVLRYNTAIDLQGEDTLKAEILRYARGLRDAASGNQLSETQADAMERYANQIPRFR